MQIYRWNISRTRALLVGGAIILGIVVITLSLVHRQPTVPPGSSLTPFGVLSNKEIGTWVWDPVDKMSTSTMAQLVNDAQTNNFNTIYLSIDPYLNIRVMPAGAARQRAENNFEAAAYNFISLAHQKNIAVDAEAGEVDWGEPQNYRNAADIVSFVQTFNASHDGKFRGVQFDIESYSLPQYTTDSTTVLTDFVGLVQTLVNQDEASSTPMPLTMIVPYFYTSDHGATPQITVDGITDYAYAHIVRVLNQLPSGDGRVMVLAYRNSASGPDGSINLAQAEISGANASNVQVIVAQETGNVQPSVITFYGMPKTELFSQTQKINDTFYSDHSYGGIAVDYLQAFLALQ
jgi:hypothetical protein